MNTDVQLLTPEAAAKLFGLKTRHLLSLPIVRYRLGHKTVRYHIDDLRAYLKQATPGAPHPQ